jgi:tetratricopeptide (TPR) repeat protein
MSSIEESIRAEIRSAGRARPEILGRIDAALEQKPTAALWILRGDAIQLSEENTHRLEDAEQSYFRAIDLDPASHEAYEALGYFHYAVMDDAANAKTFFERAIALGGSESAKEGLRDAIAELRRRKFRESLDKINEKYSGLFRRLSE